MANGAFTIDYPRGYAVTVSNTPNNTAGNADTVEGTGTNTATNVIDLGGTQTGRYLLIELTQAFAANWWSVHELSVTCEQ